MNRIYQILELSLFMMSVILIIFQFSRLHLGPQCDISVRLYSSYVFSQLSLLHLRLDESINQNRLTNNWLGRVLGVGSLMSLVVVLLPGEYAVDGTCEPGIRTTVFIAIAMMLLIHSMYMISSIGIRTPKVLTYLFMNVITFSVMLILILVDLIGNDSNLFSIILISLDGLISMTSLLYIDYSHDARVHPTEHTTQNTENTSSVQDHQFVSHLM